MRTRINSGFYFVYQKSKVHIIELFLYFPNKSVDFIVRLTEHKPRKHKKAQQLSTDTGLQHNKVIMKQTASHSNTPKFDQHKSQTSQILYQEPNLEEMHQKHNRAVEFLKNFSAVTLLLLSIFGLALVMLKGCADDVEHQQAMAVKHQLQFGGVK